MAFFQPVDEALLDWRRDARLEITLLVCTGLLLALLAGGLWYLAPATTVTSSDGLAKELTEALPGCGVWRLNLARGHIHWSAPMYRLLGLEPLDRAMPFRVISQALHPDDDLEASSTATSAKELAPSTRASGSATPRGIGSLSGCAAISREARTAASRA